MKLDQKFQRPGVTPGVDVARSQLGWARQAAGRRSGNAPRARAVGMHGGRPARGFTLIETIIVVMLAAAGIGGALYYQRVVQENELARQTADAIQVMALGVKRAYVKGDFTGLTASQINDLNLVRAPLRWDGTNLLDPWGNTMVIQPGGAIWAPKFGFILGGPGLSADNCMIIGNSFVRYASAVNIGNPIAVGGVAGTIGGGQTVKYDANSIDYSAASMRAGCAVANPQIGVTFR